MNVKKSKLTAKQKRFCEEYLIDLNATQAAIRAGYSEKTANTIAAQNLAKRNIQEYLSGKQQKRSERTEITADKALLELAALAFTDRTELARVKYVQARDAFGQPIFDEQTGKPLLMATVELTPTEELSPNARKVVAAVKQGRNGVEVTSYDKIRALELLCRHLGLFNAEKSDVDTGILSALIEGLKR